MSITAKCKKCGNIGCNGNNLLCNVRKVFETYHTFDLDEVEKENLVNYLTEVKAKYGSYGMITYSFTPTGIGTTVKVQSSHKKKAKDITNLNNW